MYKKNPTFSTFFKISSIIFHRRKKWKQANFHIWVDLHNERPMLLILSVCLKTYLIIWGFWSENIGRNLGMHPNEEPSVSNSPGAFLLGHSPVHSCRFTVGREFSLLPGRLTLANLNFNSSSPMSRFPWKASTRMVPSKQTDFLWTRNFFPWIILWRKDFP